jgi:hypothetical protein
MAHFRPLHDRILVRGIEAEEKTPGGIIIPDTAKEKPIEGEVLAVGPGTPASRADRSDLMLRGWHGRCAQRSRRDTIYGAGAADVIPCPTDRNR